MIKYFCDFCKGETTKEKCHNLDGEKTLCENCYEHLTKQTWRYAESVDEVERMKKYLAEESSKLEEEKRAWELNHSLDCNLAQRYRNGMMTALRLYNYAVDKMDNLVPMKNGFFSRERDHFSRVDIDKVMNVESSALNAAVKETLAENYHSNFNEDLYDTDFEKFSTFPMINPIKLPGDLGSTIFSNYTK